MTFGTARVTIASTKGPSTADRDLTVVFSSKSYGGSFNHVAYRKNVRLAEGQTFVIVDIPQNQTARQFAWDVQVFENGRDIENRRRLGPNEVDFEWVYQAANNESSGILVGTKDATAEVQAHVDKINEIYPATVANTTGVAPTSIRLLSIQEASSDWRQYFPYSLWVVSLPTLVEIKSKHPEVATALKRYVGAGGALLIHGVASPSDQAEVESLFFVPSDGDVSKFWSTVKAPTAPWWNRQDPSAVAVVSSMAGSMAGSIAGPMPTYATPTNSATGQLQYVYGPDGSLVQELNFGSKASESPKRTGDEPLAQLRFASLVYDAYIAAETWAKLEWGGHVDNIQELEELLNPGLQEPALDWVSGLQRVRNDLVTAVETENIQARSYLSGTLLLTSKPVDDVPRQLLIQALQHNGIKSNLGITTEMDGDWFWRNLISAVGKPPVWMFCAMVALFGALLGPGLLLFTGRIKRRSLMILLVPFLSILATLSIIAYSVLHEGFDTYTRVTSVQFIEPATGEGFAWSRQNYFSGLPPREGITFRYDTYVRPVNDDEGSTNYSEMNPRGAPCVVNLDGDQTWRGWLKARQQQQLVVGHPIEQGTLPVSVERGEDSQIMVRNLTKAEIPLVALRGDEDDYYFAESLAAGATLTLESREQVAALSNVGRLMGQLRPDVPPELNARGSLGGFGSRRGNFTIGGSYQLDVIFNTYTRYLSERAQIPNFGIVAVLRESDNVEVPLQGRSDENLHVVIGVQPW